MEVEIEGREIALRSLIKYEKSGVILKDSINKKIGDSSNSDLQRAYDYFYGCIRSIKRLDYIISMHLIKYKLDRLPVPIRNILRLGVFGLVYNRDPEYAVVDSFVSLARKYGHNGTASLVNGILRNLHPVEYPEDRIKYLSIYHSFPEWLVEKLLKIYGDSTESILKASNITPVFSIRVNCLKTDISSLSAILKNEGLNVSSVKENNVNLITDGKAIFTEAFKDGFFQVQSVTQTQFSYLLSPEKDEVILDLCASPGGKSTHIAELMGDRGVVLSVDIKGLDKIVSNCKRLGIKSVYPIRADARCFQARNVKRIMLDVPCSGTGVMSRKADIRWKLNLMDIERLKDLQMKLLINASRSIHKNGVLVYATCSILPEENQEIIHKFLKENPEFKLKYTESGEPFMAKIPDYLIPDGGFGAVLVRR